TTEFSPRGCSTRTAATEPPVASADAKDDSGIQSATTASHPKYPRTFRSMTASVSPAAYRSDALGDNHGRSVPPLPSWSICGQTVAFPWKEMRVAFGDSIFDSETRELLRAKRPVRLQPKAFQLLEVLLRRRPEALAKDELHRVLWPNTFV